MTDPSLQSSNSTVPHISSDLSMCDIKATLLLCTLIMNHTLFFNSTCGFSSVMPVLMRALESKCQIVAVCCCKCNLSSLLIHYERIYSLSEKHVNFSYYNMKFKDSAIIYIYILQGPNEILLYLLLCTIHFSTCLLYTYRMCSRARCIIY